LLILTIEIKFKQNNNCQTQFKNKMTNFPYANQFIPKDHQENESFLSFFVDSQVSPSRDNSEIFSSKVSVQDDTLSVTSGAVKQKVKKPKYKKNQIFVIKKIGKRLQRLKNKLPYLRYFNPHFTKRENIDKKILREFKNFIKVKLLDDEFYVSNKNIKNFAFWKRFVTENLLPPMQFSYEDSNEKVTFKSFNTNYHNWIFSREGADELYEDYIRKNGDEILDFLIKRYKLRGDINNNDEIHQLDFYVKNIIGIYKSKEFSIINEEDEDKNKLNNNIYNVDEHYEGENKELAFPSTKRYSDCNMEEIVGNNSEFVFTLK